METAAESNRFSSEVGAGTVGWNKAEIKGALKYIQEGDLPDRVGARRIAAVCGAEGFGIRETDCGERELLVQVYRKEKEKNPHRA